MMTRQSLIRRLLPVLIIVLSVSSFSYLKASKPERIKPQPAEKVWQVNVMPAEPQSLSPHLTLHGKVETQALLRAAAPGAGQISKVLVRPGAYVKPGQSLIIMDSRDFSVAMIQAQADVTDIQAQIAGLRISYQSNRKVVEQEQRLLELAQNEVKRVERLKKNNLSSESALSDAHEMQGKQELALLAKQLEVDRYQSTLGQLEARLARARARLTETKLAMERSEIKAEFNGIVAEVAVSAGDRVREADMLLSVYPVDSLEVRAGLPAGYQSEIQRALEAGLKLIAHAEISGEYFQLELVRLAGEARADGIDAYFRVTDGFSRLRIGNLLKVSLERPVQDAVLAVPYRAIYGNNRVYVLREGRMVAITVESVGPFTKQGEAPSLLIRSASIQKGDQIITTHLSNAVEGLKVKVVDESLAG
jgi:multidrug efflux pump subunit AcrA (membrane-fusion protein)